MEKNRIRLDDLPKRNLFSVPDEYFDDLPQRIQARVSKSAPVRQPAFTISWNWQRTIVSLASVSLVVFLIFQTMPRKQGALGTELLSTVETEAIVDYLHSQNLTAFDIEQLSKIAVSERPDSAVMQELNVSDEDIRLQLQSEDLEEAL